MTTENLHVLAEVVKESLSNYKDSISGELSQLLEEIKQKNEIINKQAKEIEELKGGCVALVEKTDIISNIQHPISLAKHQALEDKVLSLELMLKRLFGFQHHLVLWFKKKRLF